MPNIKKKKKALPLIILLILLCVLIAAYIIVKDLTDEEEVPDVTEETTIALTDYKEGDIAAIEYSVDKDTVSLRFDGKTWKVENDDKFPINQELIADMTSALGSLTAVRTVDEGELSDYGLDKPSVSVRVTLADGKEFVYNIGDTNTFSGNTYLLIGENVYMFKDTLSELFDATLEDLVLIEDAYPEELTADNITSMTLKNAVGDKYSYDSSCEDISTFLSTIKKYFTFKDFVGYGLAEEELAGYGINPDGVSIEIKYSKSASSDTSKENSTSVEATLTIYCGEAEDGTCYYAMKGGSMTYAIEKETLENTLNYLIYDYPAEMAEEEANTDDTEAQTK